MQTAIEKAIFAIEQMRDLIEESQTIEQDVDERNILGGKYWGLAFALDIIKNIQKKENQTAHE